MKNRNNIILLAIVLIIVIIIIISIILGIIYKVNKEGTDLNSNTEFEQTDTYIANNDIIEVKNRNKYFAIQKIVNSYFYYIQEMNGDIPYHLDEQYKDEVIQEQKEEGLKVIKELSNEYLKNKTDNEIQKEGKRYSSYDIKIKDMYMMEKSSNINIYFVNVLLEDEIFEIVVKTDSLNMTFSIFPNNFVEENNNDRQKMINKISNENIKGNNYNKYSLINITDEYMAKLYFNEYKEQMKNNVEEAYKLLDSNYSAIRFGNLLTFTEYVQNILNENIQIKEFMVNDNDEYKEYVCKDQYSNLYTFKETAVMKYTLTLDTYTLEQPKFNEEYEKATNQKKVQMNIDKFFQMINAKDYKAAYSVLNDEFKNNYFKTEKDFEKYMKQKVFLYNDVEYVNYQGEISSIYKYDLTIKNRLDNSQEFDISIIMQLKEGTDFVMSFSIE